MDERWPAGRGLRALPLLGNFEENILNQRLQPIRQVDGYRAKLKASSVSSSNFLAETRQLDERLEASFFAASSDSFPYLCRANLSAPFRIPARGTLQVVLLNPLGTCVGLFLLRYDLADMPANSQTFLRQRQTVGLLAPTQRHLQYLIQFNIVSSKSARIYLNKDVKIFISKRAEHLVTASHLAHKLPAAKRPEFGGNLVVESHVEMPANPKYFAR